MKNNENIVEKEEKKLSSKTSKNSKNNKKNIKKKRRWPIVLLVVVFGVSVVYAYKKIKDYSNID